MNKKFEKFKNEEFPAFIVDAISDVVTQYIIEHDIKNQNTILRFSKFAENVVKNLQKGLIEAHSEDFKDPEFISNFLINRKKLIKSNYDIYEQLEHLPAFNIPDYAIDSIVIAINEIEKEEELSEVETRDFYCLFGENIILDIRNYMQMEQVKKNIKK